MPERHSAHQSWPPIMPTHLCCCAVARGQTDRRADGHQTAALDRCHKCDSVALERDFIARDNVAADAAAVMLHAATLSRKQTRLLHHFSRFTIRLHKHSSKMMKLFGIYFFGTLRLIIVCFRFARQPTKTELPRISSSVMLVWFVYAIKSQV